MLVIGFRNGSQLLIFSGKNTIPVHPIATPDIPILVQADADTVLVVDLLQLFHTLTRTALFNGHVELKARKVRKPLGHGFFFLLEGPQHGELRLAFFPCLDIVIHRLGAPLDLAGLRVDDRAEAGKGLHQALAGFEPVALAVAGQL